MDCTPESPILMISNTMAVFVLRATTFHFVYFAVDNSLPLLHSCKVEEHIPDSGT